MSKAQSWFGSPRKNESTVRPGAKPAKAEAGALRALLLALLVIAICIGVNGYARSAGRTSSASPVLLELFTSEGCSTCPPADAFLQRMDSTQPVPGADLIVLSEHVDYWDHQGWKDPYSSHSFTDRQRDYEQALHVNTPYTPQIIVDGTTVLRGNPGQVRQALTAAATDQKIPVRLSAVAVESGPSPAIRAHIDVDGEQGKHDAEVYVALALDHAQSQVLRGENQGKHLAYVAVVEEIKKVGKLEKQKKFDRDVQLTLKHGTDPKNLRLIAFVQESGPGKVLGAAMQRPGN